MTENIFDALANSWDNEPARKEVPEGKHLATVKNVKVDTNDKGSRLIFEMYFPEFNTVEWDSVTISEKTGGLVRARFSAMGYSDLKPADIPKIMGAVGGTKVTITKKSRPGSKYFNYYWDKADKNAKDEHVPF